MIVRVKDTVKDALTCIGAVLLLLLICATLYCMSYRGYDYYFNHVIDYRFTVVERHWGSNTIVVKDNVTGREHFATWTNQGLLIGGYADE